MNKAVLVGRLVRDPDLKFAAGSGNAVSRFTLAVTRQFKRDEADFISCVAFGQQADFMSRYIRKGYMIAVEGRIQTGQYQDQNNQVRYTTDVVVERVENLQPRDPNQMTQNYQQPQQNQYQQNPYQGYNNPTYGQAPQAPIYQQPQASKEEVPQTFNVDVADDDLPF